MDRLSDTRSLGSGRSRGVKQRLPLPSQQSELIGEEVDLLSQFSDSQPSKSSKKSRNLPLPSEMGDMLGSDLLSSLVSTENVDLRSNPSKRSSNRKKLPLPSQGINGDSNSLLGEFLTSTTNEPTKNAKGLAPSFKKKSTSSILDENGQNDLLERLSSLSSKSTGSTSKKSMGSKNSTARRNLPRPSDMGAKDDLLSMFSNQGETDESVVAETYETIVYDPEDEQDGAVLSPREVIKEASDVLSLLSGHEGGIKPSVLTSRGKYSDDDSKSISSNGSRDRPASKVSGTGYISDVSRVSSRAAGVTASLTSSMGEGRQWNQNRAYFLRTAKLRGKNKDSPLNKFLPGGSMSSTGVRDERPNEAQSMDTELIEQLQLELEEARRTIRSHETKIMALQDGWRSFWDNYSRFVQYLDEVEAARESCMEEECERVEAEIAKERVHNENRMLKVQLQQLESIQSSTGSDKSTPTDVTARRRPVSAFEPLTLNSIAIQTEDSNIRNVKSMGDFSGPIKMTSSLRELQESTTENLLSDVVSKNGQNRPLGKSHSAVSFNDLKLNQQQLNQLNSIQEEADGIVIPLPESGPVAIPFRKKSVSYKVEIISHWVKSLVLRQSDFSGTLYKEAA